MDCNIHTVLRCGMYCFRNSHLNSHGYQRCCPRLLTDKSTVGRSLQLPSNVQRRCEQQARNGHMRTVQRSESKSWNIDNSLANNNTGRIISLSLSHHDWWLPARRDCNLCFLHRKLLCGFLDYCRVTGCCDKRSRTQFHISGLQRGGRVWLECCL